MPYSTFKARRHLPLVVPLCKCISFIIFLFNTKGQKYLTCQHCILILLFDMQLQRERGKHSALMSCQKDEALKAEKKHERSLSKKRKRKIKAKSLHASIHGVYSLCLVSASVKLSSLICMKTPQIIVCSFTHLSTTQLHNGFSNTCSQFLQ